MKLLTGIIAAYFAFAACVASAQTTAITGATVHTVGPAGTLENATVIIENGRIADVGTGIQVPAGGWRRARRAGQGPSLDAPAGARAIYYSHDRDKVILHSGRKDTWTFCRYKSVHPEDKPQSSKPSPFLKALSEIE